MIAQGSLFTNYHKLYQTEFGAAISPLQKKKRKELPVSFDNSQFSFFMPLFSPHYISSCIIHKSHHRVLYSRIFKAIMK